jgi:hypothetical protein
VETIFEVKTLLHDGNQDVNRHCNTDLSTHGILGCAEECLDAKMLLNPPEKEFDLPP